MGEWDITVLEPVNIRYTTKWVKTNGRAFDWEVYSSLNEDGGHAARNDSAHTSQRQLATQIGVSDRHVGMAMQILRYCKKHEV